MNDSKLHQQSYIRIRNVSELEQKRCDKKNFVTIGRQKIGSLQVNSITSRPFSSIYKHVPVFFAFSSLSCKILAQNHFDNIHGHNNSKNLRTIPICMWNGFYFLSLPSFPSVIILLHGKKYSMSAFLSRPGEWKPSQFHNEWIEIRKLEGNEMDKCTHANK